MRRCVRRFVAVGMALGLFSAVAFARPEKQSGPLRDEDVIALSKAGLGDDLIIAKIQSSPKTDFDTSTEALIRLKKAGVSNAVLDVMVRPAAPRSASVDHRPGQPGKWKTGVRLVTKDSVVDLDSIEGVEGTTFIGVGFLLWNNYPGQHSQTRISDPDAYILVLSDKSPTGRWFLVRLDANDKESDRSLKMGRSSLFTSRSAGRPDNEWTIQFEATQESSGVWRIKPKSPLKADEYGLWKGTGELYDFGVE